MTARLSRSTRDRADAATDAALRALIDAAVAIDGQPPFNEASLLEKTEVVFFERGGTLVGAAMTGAEVEFVVHPEQRRRGYGDEMLRALLVPGFTAWAHGDHPGARVLAERHGLERVRTLLQLRVGLDQQPPLVEPVETEPAETSAQGLGKIDQRIRIDTFRPGHDDEEWVALNARAFASHPEQGRITIESLQPRIAENPAEHFLVGRDAQGRMVGYCWLKIDGELGEIYVLGVDPDRAGQGIGRVLLKAGLAHLKALGIRESNLYVEADNEAALRLYRGFGYSEYTVDVLYATPR
ncbi:mycothiol synthase [Diaminobutyricimonas sp. TR449]|uniref:mycothiol synthase n=1 Tax=Diaminobutyricimonas sp. TR449 TaxID=2708076 RepID=UPI0014232EF5|nr:mycothiol synthase [Diaminobutyricimonas sp. TR449]